MTAALFHNLTIRKKRLQRFVDSRHYSSSVQWNQKSQCLRIDIHGLVTLSPCARVCMSPARLLQVVRNLWFGLLLCQFMPNYDEVKTNCNSDLTSVLSWSTVFAFIVPEPKWMVKRPLWNFLLTQLPAADGGVFALFRRFMTAAV